MTIEDKNSLNINLKNGSLQEGLLILTNMENVTLENQYVDKSRYIQQTTALKHLQFHNITNRIRIVNINSINNLLLDRINTSIIQDCTSVITNVVITNSFVNNLTFLVDLYLRKTENLTIIDSKILTIGEINFEKKVNKKKT